MKYAFLLYFSWLSSTFLATTKLYDNTSLQAFGCLCLSTQFTVSFPDVKITIMKITQKYLKIAVKYILTIVSTIIFLVQSSKCIKIFQAKESVSTSKIVSSGSAEFPALSICADFFDAYKTDILENYDSSPENIRSLKFPNTSYLESLPLFESVTLNLTELIQSVEFNFHEPFPGTKVSHLLLAQEVNEENDQYMVKTLENEDWIQKNWLTLGRCYTYKLPQELRKLNVRSITIVTNVNLLVYIHHPGQFWWVDTDTKIPISKHQLSFLDVRHTVVHALPKEVNGTEFLSCSEEMDFGYDACYHRSFDERFYEEFKCLHPLMLSKMNTTRSICNIGQFTPDEQQKFAQLHNGKCCSDFIWY